MAGSALEVGVFDVFFEGVFEDERAHWQWRRRQPPAPTCWL
jgi:hypothetical protein